MFAPQKGLEDPVIRHAMHLCEEAGMKVRFLEDTVEVWFAPNNKRYYTVWRQFLNDAEAIFGERLHDPSIPPPPKPASAAPPVNGYKPFDPPPAPRWEPPPPPIDLPARLQREIEEMTKAIQVLVMQRDEWRRDAESLRNELALTRAEIANLTSARGAAPGAPDRYKQVRQVIARRLHPDVPGTDAEKAYREKLFKMIWSEIEALDKR